MQVVTADIEQWYSLQQTVLGARVALAFTAFREAGIEPILIKGWAAAQNYPEAHIRRPGDIDLAVAPDDYQTASILIRKAAEAKLNIDLHNGLRQLDALDWAEVFGHSVLIDHGGTAIRVLSPEDHLRVLATHWLIDGGGYRDKLWDIYYAVANRPEDFDWDRCLDVVDNNRRGWVICAIAIAHRYLDLDVSDLPFESELVNIPKWITKCVEREWSRPGRLEPILTSTHDTTLLMRQIGWRMPPNPIRATIEGNGDLYGSRRWWYQIGVLARRSGPFLKDTLSFAVDRLRQPLN